MVRQIIEMPFLSSLPVFFWIVHNSCVSLKQRVAEALTSALFHRDDSYITLYFYIRILGLKLSITVKIISSLCKIKVV